MFKGLQYGRKYLLSTPKVLSLILCKYIVCLRPVLKCLHFFIPVFKTTCVSANNILNNCKVVTDSIMKFLESIMKSVFDKTDFL